MTNQIVTPAEIEERYSITQQTRSKWTKQYSKFLSPRNGFHRTYTNDDIAVFDFIVACKDKMLTAPHIIKLLEDGATEVPEIIEAEPQAEKYERNVHTPPPQRKRIPSPENSIFSSFGKLEQRVDFIDENNVDIETDIGIIKSEMKKFHERLRAIEAQLGISNPAMYPSPETDIIIARK